MAIRETVEREVKLRAGESFRLPELGGEAIEPRLFVSTYHDTADHRLSTDYPARTSADYGLGGNPKSARTRSGS